MANTYDIGDNVRVSSLFRTGGVTPVDPSTVALVMRVPDGTATTYTYALAEVIKDATGTFHRDFAIAAAGRYRYRWTSTGTGAASEEGWFEVRSRAVS